MARTIKDAPYKVQERKELIAPKRACAICEIYNKRSGFVTKYSQIFKASDKKTIESFIAAAHESGFEVTSQKESFQFLGTAKSEHTYAPKKPKSLQSFLQDSKKLFDRLDYEQPNEDELEASSIASGQHEFYKLIFAGLFDRPEQEHYDIATKRDLYVAITIERVQAVTPLTPEDCWHGQSHSRQSSFSLGRWAGCGCHYDNPKKNNNVKKSSLKKIKNNFNSGNMEDFYEEGEEEI